MALLMLKQLTILLWKCWILRRRHWISSIFELLLPLLLSFVLTGLWAKGQSGSTNWVDAITHNTPSMTVSNNTNVFPHVGHDRKLKIYYIPKTPFTYELMNRVYDYVFDDNCNKADCISINPTDNETYYDASLSVGDDINAIIKTTLMGIKFHLTNNTSDTPPHDFKYTIQYADNSMSMAVRRLFPMKFNMEPTDFQPYRYFFAPLQTLVNRFYTDMILEHHGKEKINISSTNAYQFPYPKYLKILSIPIKISANDLITLCIVFGYVVMCPLIVKRICDEKAAKSKEMLRMMGMSDWVFWGSHFINYFSVMFIQNIIITFVFCHGFGGDSIINLSNPYLIFMILQLYCTQTLLLCMSLTTLFTKPIIAVIVTVIIWIVTMVLPNPLLNPSFHPDMDVIATNPIRAIVALFPNMGLVWCFQIIGQYDNYGTAANWSNLWSDNRLFLNFSIGYVTLIMSISCFVYGILIWYLDAVWPWQFGVPKPLYFPFMPSYWCTGDKSEFINHTDDERNGNGELQKNKDFEDEPNISVGISTKCLRKEFGYGNSRKTAVDNVSLNVYRGQITVLLGHNGAGKTTTMNMITGIFPSTRGTVFVDGYNVKTQTKQARKSMGLCPQENILYNELSVEQHLKLYAILKDYPWKNVNEEVNHTLDLVRLSDKKHELASSLSGGMKRKLSLAIALIGDTNILILDEPSSGMDPEARRAVWDLLQKIRSERTILLTTHFMEEADVLGDRIAIMAEGKVKCFGSPMFLKKRFGAGYHLRIAKGRKYNPTAVDNLIRKYLPYARMKSEIQSEVIYSLENNIRRESFMISMSLNDTKSLNGTSKFPDLFDDIERNRENIGVASCGLSVTTMEDVFFKVGSDHEPVDKSFTVSNNKHNNNNRNINGYSTENLVQAMHKNTGVELLGQRIYGLLIKRFHYSRRNWPMMIFQIALPGVLFFVVILIDYLIKNSSILKPKDLELNLSHMYGKTHGFIHDPTKKYEELYSKIALTNSMTTDKLKPNEKPNDWAMKYADESLDNYIKTNLIGGEFEYIDDSIILKPWFNLEAVHSMPLSINLIYETIINYELSGITNVTITVNNHPLYKNNAMMQFALVLFAWAFSCLLLTPITIPFIGASYVLFAINEHTSKSKLLQIMSGLSSLTFWITNYIFDLLSHLIAMIVIFAVFFIFDHLVFKENVYFSNSNTIVGLFLMLFLFGFASIPLAYCFSYWLKKPSTGFAVLVIIYLIFGLVLNIAMSFLDAAVNIFVTDLITKGTFNTLLGIFRLFPIFSMSFGIQKLYRVGSFASACKVMSQVNREYLILMCQTDNPLIYGCCEEKCKPKGDCFNERSAMTFDDYGIGIELIYMIIDGFVFLFILWLLEGNIQKLWYRFKIRNQKNINYNDNIGMEMVNTNNNIGNGFAEDSDVVAERQRIRDLYKRQMINTEAMAVMDLSKTFVKFKAVDHLTFGIHKEECFGLLGVNGAGKTTSFRMLTGDLFMSEGNAYIGKQSLCGDLHMFQQQIGYCPQFDALLDRLTGREMLYLFARLRGVPEDAIHDNVQNMIEMVDLQKHADKCTVEYSGGNKRKLSLALAIIGTPPVIFLDEPTSGVDPAARRKIWTTLVYIQEKYKCSIVLTSHSMDECEALCSRIAIMVNGKFKCLGPTQHLRSKYGEGFTVIIKLKRELNDDPNYISHVQNYIQSLLASAVLKDSHECLLHYHITDTTIQLSKLFRIFEAAKNHLQFEDYTVSDTTLEQIFLTFARNQR